MRSMSYMNGNGNGKVLVRKRDGRIIAGVCAGLAEYAGIDVNLLRVIVVADQPVHGRYWIACLRDRVDRDPRGRHEVLDRSGFRQQEPAGLGWQSVEVVWEPRQAGQTRCDDAHIRFAAGAARPLC